ncbi:MAG: short-chain dehydrogenase [Bdellovibrio sp.]|nr:MAG: short-chain dehydrogenase [Bdellovibrio sp.]
MQLKNRTVLITGGASGIGLEFAKQLLAKQNTVIITGRNPEKLAKAKAQLPKLHAIRSDVSDITQVESLCVQVCRDFPDLDVLINNAGIMKTMNLHEERSLQDVTKEIETNLMGPIRMTQKFLPHLKKRPAAALVNVSSGLAFVPLPISPVYCATKAGLHSFTLSLRVQLAQTKVKVFEVAPPATETELLGDFNSPDMKGISIMKVDAMVEHSIRGIENDHYEIRPGQSNQLKFMSRLAPEFILNQMSKPVERMLKGGAARAS